MKLFESHIDHFSLDIKRPVDRVVAALQLHVDTSKRSFIANKLFYGETYQQLTNDTFKITRQRVQFDPFRGTGQITLELLPGDTSDKTKVVIQTTPLEGYKDGIPFMIFMFIILSALGLLTSTDIYTIINIVLMWTVLPLIGHFWFKWSKAKLRDYTYVFLRKVLDQSERTTQGLLP